MNGRLPDMQTEKADQLDAAPERATRYLPAPQTAAELAAIEAALHGPAHSGRITRTRVLVGSAVIALAVTIPDLSLGAMGSPYNPLSPGEPAAELPARVWTPAARPVGPVYAPIMAAQELAPEALALMNRAKIGVLIVREGDRAIGILHLHDLLRVGVI